MGRRAWFLVVLAASSAACASERPNDDAAQLADPFPDLVFGAVDDFAAGSITELDTPRHVFVVARGDELTVLYGKDPNIGCRLDLVDDELRSAVDVPDAAVFWDPCHGNAYDDRGLPLVTRDADAMWQLDVVERDGSIVFPLP